MNCPDKTELDVAAFGEDGGGLLVALAESVQGGDDVIARAGDGKDQVEERLRSATGGYTALAAFQGCQPLLQDADGGRLAAPVDVVGEFVEGLVRIRHGLDDGGHKGAELFHVFQRVESGVQRLGIETLIAVWTFGWLGTLDRKFHGSRMKKGLSVCIGLCLSRLWLDFVKLLVG